MNEAACRSAVVGSLRPCPVSTQTTRASRSSLACGRGPGHAGHAGGRGRLAEDPLLAGEGPVGRQDLVVADGVDPAARRVASVDRLGPRGRVADPDGGRDRVGSLDPVADHERRRAGRLEAPHPRSVADDAGRGVLAEALPVGADVAGIADRDGQDLRRPAQVVADLEGSRLLALEAERVDRVDQGDRVVVLLGERTHDPERLVEVAVDRHDSCPGDQRLEQLADGDLALGQDDDDLHAGGRTVGGRRRGRVAGRGAHDRPGTGLGGLGHGEHHAAVLERSGRVLALDLQVEIRQADGGAQPVGSHERGRPFAEGQRRRRLGDRQEPSIAVHQPRPTGRGAEGGGHASSTG